jgi:hypothetical protein
LQVEPGDRIEFVEVDSGRFEVVAATLPVKELKGMFVDALPYCKAAECAQ